MFHIQKFGHCLTYLSCTALLGCSTNPERLSGLTKSDSNIEAQIQICLPEKRVYFHDVKVDQVRNHPHATRYTPEQLELVPKVVRRVAESNDPKAIQNYFIKFGDVIYRNGFSSGMGAAHLKDSTVKNQPVYMDGVVRPAKDYVAIRVALLPEEQGPEGHVTYWFALPKSIPTDKFSGWLPPVSMEPKDTQQSRKASWWQLTHGGKLEVYPVVGNPPKMRVMLRNRGIEHTDPVTDSLPALRAARWDYKTETSGKQFAYEFVAKSNEIIPACG